MQIEVKSDERSVARRLHPFLFDVMTTGLTQAATLAANFILLGAVSKQMGVVALGEYLLVKRVSSWLNVGSQLGLGIALPRQIAHVVVDVEARARQYFLAALTVMLVFVMGVGLAAALNAERVARWCLGSEKRGLVYAMLLLLFGMAAQAALFGYFRGLERVRMANLVAFGSTVVPLLALALTYRCRSASILIGATGLGLTVLSLSWAIPKIAALGFSRRFITDARELLSYGVGRIPGDVAMGGLLALGPMLVSHRVSISQNSYLLLGITCMSMGGVAFAPLSMLLLARISRLLAAGRRGDVNVYVGHLRSAVLQLSLVLVVQGLIFARPLVLWWLGPSCVVGVPVIRTVMLAIPAYMYYAAFRSVVDASSSTAYNARNVLIALAVLIVLLVAVICFVPQEKIVIATAAATTVAMCTLAVATHVTLRALRLMDHAPQLGPMWLAGVLAIASLAAQLAFRFQITQLAFGLVLLLNIGLTFLFLRRFKPEWLGFVLRVGFLRT